jgi:hypothetical protein
MNDSEEKEFDDVDMTAFYKQAKTVATYKRIPPLPVEDKLSKIVEYVDGSKIASRFKGLTIPVLEYNEAMAVLKKSLPVEDKEEQENLWKLALHHAGSRMDFMKFLTDQFVIKPRKQLE